MASIKLDYKKEYPDLYRPKAAPMLLDVPAMSFIQVDGTGDPSSASYQEALQLLYALSFTIKMSKMSGNTPAGYFDYVVPPLEGLWWSPGSTLDLSDRANWQWTAMIRQPEFVTPDVFAWACVSCRTKKPELPLERARFASFSEGLCVQALHVGPYDAEADTIEKLAAFAKEQGYAVCTGVERKHHELYLSDPRRVAPERLKTVLRLPVSPL